MVRPLVLHDSFFTVGAVLEDAPSGFAVWSVAPDQTVEGHRRFGLRRVLRDGLVDTHDKGENAEEMAHVTCPFVLDEDQVMPILVTWRATSSCKSCV